MSWVRRIAAIQRRCSNCWGLIDRDEEYFMFLDGRRLCCECPPEETDGEECET
jgi:hypothetical protein